MQDGKIHNILNNYHSVDVKNTNDSDAGNKNLGGSLCDGKANESIYHHFQFKGRYNLLFC